MHPAGSIVFFTVASGAGYGIMFLLGVIVAPGGAFAFGGLEDGPGFAVALALALGLVSAGLVSSAFHLGRPERALLAFTQWRTSWLSREGCLAAATYAPAAAIGAGWWAGEPDGAWRYLGPPLALGAAATVYCTAMIYRSLAAVPRWCNPWVPAGYLTLAGASGAVWLAFVAAWFAPEAAAAFAGGAASLLALAAVVKGGYWRAIHRRRPESTIESATGLAPAGGEARVRVLDPPHTEPNWLQREMGYRVARRHARKLRAVTWALAFALPIALCGAVWSVGAPTGAGPVQAAALGLAAASASAGILVERWLFFAEAEHKTALYYGERRV